MPHMYNNLIFNVKFEYEKQLYVELLLLIWCVIVCLFVKKETKRNGEMVFVLFDLKRIKSYEYYLNGKADFNQRQSLHTMNTINKIAMFRCRKSDFSAQNTLHQWDAHAHACLWHALWFSEFHSKFKLQFATQQPQHKIKFSWCMMNICYDRSNIQRSSLKMLIKVAEHTACAFVHSCIRAHIQSDSQHLIKSHCIWYLAYGWI